MVQLRKLRLSGFKSFVDPTELVIEDGVTGIVGPNGCGKSNLVEALRWVMGENSAKRMRGGGMDDVIFAGSSGRPARNLAEVTLLLDNGDRTAPAAINDQDELEVTRRIERDSGSTYRINGRETRARDVQLLFADSSTGAHSAAMVGQGRVGALINAKPSDRRILLEEAAGITGLYSRRHEAELRLRAAETNLERLDDVIATLEAQLQGLKKQARQAKRYRRIAEQIRRSEAILLHLESVAAGQALQRARDQLAAAEAAVAELTGTAAARATDQAAAAAALPELRQAETEAAAALQRLLVDRDNLEREEAQVAAARIQAEQRRAQIEHDRGRARALADDAALALERLGEEERALATAAGGEADARALAEQEQAAAESLVGDGEAALAELAQSLAANDARGAALAQRIAELAARAQRLRARAAELATARDRLAGEQVGEAVLHQAAQDQDLAEAKLARAREAGEAAEGRLRELRDREAQARDRLQDSQAVAAKLEAEVAALSAILEPSESDLWPPLVDAVTVQPGYETALGAALGDDLGAPSDEAAPIHWRCLPPFDAAAPLPAGARPLSQFVRAPDVLARRLSQIGVVDDAAAGARASRGLSAGQRLVTRDGDLWRWDGYTAHADAPTGAAVRLAQHNRLRDLRPRSDAAASSFEALRVAHQGTRDAVAEAADQERAARGALDAAFAAVNAAREAKTRLAQAAAAAETRLAANAEAAERLHAERGEADQELARARGDQTASPDLSAARARLTELRAELAEQRTGLAARQSHLDRLLREAEARAERQSAIALERTSWAKRAAESDGHLDDLDQRRVEAERELERLAAQPLEIAERRDALAELIDSAEARRQQAADGLALGETRQGEADRALRAEEQRLAQAREERVRGQAAVEQAEVGRAALAEQVRERLDCDPDQALEVAEVDPSQDLPPRDEVEDKLARMLRERDNMGPVNLRAEQEAEELEQRIAGMLSERSDLISAIARLRQGIASLNREGRERLLGAFEAVNRHFTELFVRLFGGGRAHLTLVESEDPLEAGLEIMASPPGKRLQIMSLLSGGEQALTALALLFAVFLTNPAPICVLDEVDAPLDDANVERFCLLIDELSRQTSTRFLIVTHHRITMARMDRLFGVTMAERGISQLVSVDLGAAEELRESA